MTSPAWGLAQGGSFQNALATGLQFGQMARQRAEEKEFKNALAQYDPSNPETIKPIMAVDPRTGIQLRQQQTQLAAQQRETRQADMGTFRRLLKHAAQSPEGWQQAVGAAQSMGLDLSGLPQQYDPEWANQQLFLFDALETPEGKEALSTAGKQAVDMGFKPGTPEFQEKVTELWQQNGAIPYTDEQGATRLYIPGRGTPTSQPVSEGTVIENDAGEKMVLRDGKWQALPKGGAGASGLGANFLDGL